MLLESLYTIITRHELRPLSDYRIPFFERRPFERRPFGFLFLRIPTPRIGIVPALSLSPAEVVQHRLHFSFGAGDSQLMV
jgi:hypothetical protein